MTAKCSHDSLSTKRTAGWLFVLTSHSPTHTHSLFGTCPCRYHDASLCTYEDAIQADFSASKVVGAGYLLSGDPRVVQRGILASVSEHAYFYEYEMPSHFLYIFRMWSCSGQHRPRNHPVPLQLRRCDHLYTRSCTRDAHTHPGTPSHTFTRSKTCTWTM